MISKKKAVLMQILYLLVYDTLIAAVYAIHDDNEIDRSLTFNATIVGNNPVFKFTCESLQRPIGDAISFQVNLITVDVIRYSNNKCYDRYTECRADTCSCYYDGIKFKIEYWYEVLNFSQSFDFGVEMILKDSNANIVVVTLSRFYNGKDFEKLEIVKETNQYEFMENTDKFDNDQENGARKEWILSASLGVSLMMIFCVLCIHRLFSNCSIEKFVSVPDVSEGLKTFTSYIARNEHSESGYDDSESNLLTVDDEPAKDKPFVFSHECLSYGKNMQDNDNKKEFDRLIDGGRTDSDGQINITSGIESAPVFCKYPADETMKSSYVFVQGTEDNYQPINMSTKEQFTSNQSTHDERESVLDAEYEPAKDKPFVINQVKKSLSKRMQNCYYEQKIHQFIDAGSIDSEKRKNPTSGMEPHPVSCEYPEDETVLAKEMKNVVKSSFNSIQQTDEDDDTEEVSSDFDEMESDHLYEDLAEDNNSEGHKWTFKETGYISSEDIESEEDSSDFEEIDFELPDGTISTCLIDTPSAEHDESEGMLFCTSLMSTSEQLIPNESEHEEKDFVTNILYNADEPAKDKSLVISQVDKSLNRMEYGDNVKESDQSVVATRAHSNKQTKIGPTVLCEDYQVDTIQISIYDEHGFYLSCMVKSDSGEQFEGDDDDNISECDFGAIGLVPFEDTDLEDDCYKFIEIGSEYTPSITTNKEKALLVIEATEAGKSRSIKSMLNSTMHGSYSKYCRPPITCKTAKKRKLESKTSPNTVNGVPKINFIVNDISIVRSMESQDLSVPYNTLKYVDRRIEFLTHTAICRSFRFHICSCVNRQDSKLGHDVLQHYFLDLKNRKSKLMLQHE